MPWKPQFEGDFPTLGWGVIDWMNHYLATPDHTEYVPLRLYPEQEDFLLRFYELDPRTGRRVRTRGVLSRPRGWGKSPFVGGMMACEGLGPVLFDGWDGEGQPVGKPWSMVRTPLVQLAAVSEAQTQNTWLSLLEMLEGPNLYDDYPGLEPMGGFVNLPVGKIVPVTSSARSVKGARAVFAAMDQTEEWVQSNGGISLAEKMRSNAAKVGGTTVETPNAFIPGEGSVAEKSAETWQKILAGETTDDGEGLYYDHREAPADTDMSERESLVLGLRVAYGDSSGHPDGCLLHEPACPPGHMDLDRLVREINDPAKDVQVSRSDFLNQVTHASDAWISKPALMACEDRSKTIQPGDKIVLGFDGSRGRNRGKADATALAAIRIKDAHLFELAGGVQEPRLSDGPDWTPNVQQVEACIRAAFETYQVVGFYADPSGWAQQVASWEAEYGRRLKVRASRDNPIAVWPRGKDSRVAEVLQHFWQAIMQGEMTHDGGMHIIRHFLNARRRYKRGGVLIYKAYPESPDKIDMTYAAAMAWKAYLDAVSRGMNRRTSNQKGRMLVLR